MATNNAALFIINALKKPVSTGTPTPGVQAQTTAKAIISGVTSGTTNYNIIMQPITFIANTLVHVMNYIATAAMVIAGALFAFEILKMAIEYMINHEASTLTKNFVKKILLFLIISAVATNLQSIMSFIFGSFVSFGQGVGSDMMGSAPATMGNPLSAWYWLITIFQYTMQSESKAIPDGVIASIGATPYLIANAVFMYAILVIIFLLIIFALIQFFIIQIEILIQMSIGAIAIAFSMLSYTDYITKNYFKSLINTGLRLFTIIVIIYFFNYCMIYAGMLMEEIETQIVKGSTSNPFQIIMTALLSILFLSILTAFMVAKGPGIVANAFNGSGEGSGMDAAMVMGGAAGLATGGASAVLQAPAAIGSVAGGAASIAGGTMNAASKIGKTAYNAPGAVVDGFKSAPNKFMGMLDKVDKASSNWENDWRKRLNKTDFKQDNKN